MAICKHLKDLSCGWVVEQREKNIEQDYLSRNLSLICIAHKKNLRDFVGGSTT